MVVFVNMLVFQIKNCKKLDLTPQTLLKMYDSVVFNFFYNPRIFTIRVPLTLSCKNKNKKEGFMVRESSDYSTRPVIIRKRVVKLKLIQNCLTMLQSGPCTFK